MKGKWKFFLLLSAVAVVACTKEWSGRRQGQAALKNGLDEGSGGAVYASEWTTLRHWEKDQQGFYSEQSLGRRQPTGKVLMFARNVWQEDENTSETDIPLQLPFNFLPYTDEPGLTQTWQYELEEDKLRVNLAITGTETAVAPREVAVRYVIIPQPLWDKLALSEPDAEAMPYEDLVAKLDIKP